MANSGEGGSGNVEGSGNALAAAKSVPLAQRGIESSEDFRNLMSALMGDVITGTVSPDVTNAACNAGGKLLKMVELEYKYAANAARRERVLHLSSSSQVPATAAA